MNTKHSLRILSAAIAFVSLAGGAARADYYSHPELRPSYRCGDIPAGIGCEVDNNPVLADGTTQNPNFGNCIAGTEDLGGIQSLHCQRLFWDLPVTTELGTVAVAAPYASDPIPRFPNGITDRLPPMWVGTLASDIPDLGKSAGEKEGFEREEDCIANSQPGSCARLCPDPLDVPYWMELTEANGDPIVDTDGSGREGVNEQSGEPTGQPQTGPLFQVACQRGTRSYYGPWQTGGIVDLQACLAEPNHAKDATAGACQGPVFDRLAATVPIKFENTDRLDDDATAEGVSPDEFTRLEWNTGTEYYNHFSSHHGTCYQPSEACTDVNDPPSRADMNDPNGACAEYQRKIGPTSSCYAGDSDPRGCTNEDRVSMGGFRNATQLPGRLSVPLPDGRGVLSTEDPVWGCNHHVVTQLPPGSYGMDRIANYRLQTRGLENDKSDVIYGTDPGDEYGGAVGEMIIQYFARPRSFDVKPVNANFNALADLATTYYPPFTWMYHESEWLPPFDSEVAIMAIHAHHRMVKGTMNVAPVNPPRLNATDPYCGGPQADGTPATDLYTNWYWEDSPVCQYWKQVDGPVPMRKGQSLRTTCYVNNGITPEAIKHGLVAGATVQTLKAMGAPIPDYPAVGSASTWGAALAESEVGKEFLYGTHPPVNYRVVYKCSTNDTLAQVPGGSLVQAPAEIGDLYRICSPNPAIDADLDYIDGAYYNDQQCGGGLCEPSSIVFACQGEDEMCIGVALYWAMDRILNPDGSVNEAAMEHVDAAAAALQGGDAETALRELNNTGTPGSTGQPTDYPAGNCAECNGPEL